MGKVLALLSPKGGVGKSTISLMLARALQLDGFNVVVVDSDPLGTSIKWSAFEREDIEMFPVYGISHSALEREVKRAKTTFDFIIIDGGAKLEVPAMAPSIRVADLILVPVHPSGADIWGSEELIRGIKARQEFTEGQPLAYFVVSCQIIGTGLAKEVTEALEEYELPVLNSRTSTRIAYPESITAGLTVFEVDRDGKAVGEITQLKNEVLEILNG